MTFHWCLIKNENADVCWIKNWLNLNPNGCKLNVIICFTSMNMFRHFCKDLVMVYHHLLS